MTLDIETEFQKILLRYGYSRMEEDFRREMYREIRTILHDVCGGNHKVAIKCAGIHTSRLMEDFIDVLKIDCIIDNNPERIEEEIQRFHIPIFRSYKGRNINTVIISSFEFRRECKQELGNDPGIEIVDIYDKLMQKGYYLSKEYYKYIGEPYKAIIKCQYQYKQCRDTKEKERFLDQLIGHYLDIRDIYSAQKYVKEYIKYSYKKKKEKEKLLEELEQLLVTIKRKCNDRNQKDILWFWQDALPFEYVKEMQYLSKEANKGIFFEQAYTPSWVTRSVYARILDQKEEYDIYNNKNNWPKEHKTIEFMKSKGYDCRKIMCIGKQHIPLDRYDIQYSKNMLQQATATEIWWEALRELLLSEKPVFFLLHTGMETHVPIVSPALDEYTCIVESDIPTRYTPEGEKLHRERLKKNVNYIDQEWKFFIDILGDNSIKIFMSDHGDVLRKETRQYTKDALHVAMIVTGRGVPCRQYCRLFCLTDFLKLLVYLLEQNERNEAQLFSDEIWLNGVDFYNKRVIEKYNEIECLELGISYNGILTLMDRYVKLGTGEEIYHIFPDECTNCIKDKRYQKRIKILRKHAGECFIDINKNPKFKYSHLLYEALGKMHI